MRMRAERRCGELLRGMPKSQGGRPATKNQSPTATSSPPKLADMGITKQQASDWRRLADMPKKRTSSVRSARESPAGLLSY
jgi:hypothetical protein